MSRIDLLLDYDGIRNYNQVKFYKYKLLKNSNAFAINFLPFSSFYLKSSRKLKNI